MVMLDEGSKNGVPPVFVQVMDDHDLVLKQPYGDLDQVTT